MHYESPRNGRTQKRIMEDTSMTAFTQLQKTQNVKVPQNLNESIIEQQSNHSTPATSPYRSAQPKPAMMTGDLVKTKKSDFRDQSLCNFSNAQTDLVSMIP
jgi:hypothetical protein